MPIYRAIALIQKHRPTEPTEFKKIGLELRFLGAGVFREGYRIIGTDLCVKLPMGEGRGARLDYHAGKVHSTVEHCKIARLSKYPELRPHLPRVYYHDRKTGVLVMSYHDDFVYETERLEELGKVVGKLIKRLTGVVCRDIHGNNIRQRKSGQLVFTDLGY